MMGREYLDLLFFTAIRAQAVTVLLLALGGCESDPQVTTSSTLTVYPTERSIDINTINNLEGQCLYQSDMYQDAPVSIRLANASGTPIGNADISIYVDYAGNTFSGQNVLELYADSNSNGVVDSPDELVSDTDDDIYIAKTDEYSGVVSLLLRVNVSCPYRGHLYAFAGPVAGSMEISVTSNNTGGVE